MTIKETIQNKIKEFEANIAELQERLKDVDGNDISAARSLYRMGIQRNRENIELLNELLNSANKEEC
jgi:hypothetical protein